MARNQDGHRGMLKFEPNFDPGQLIFRSVPIGSQWRPIIGLKMGTRGFVCRAAD